MEKQPLRDLIVVLPGILGSILKRGSAEIWAPNAGCAYRAASGPDALALTDEPGDPAALADGVEATGLVPDIHMIPGLWKIDGYTRLVEAIQKTFHTKKAHADEDKLANVILFPYDWRRSNRITAGRLKLAVDRFLPRWRKETYFKDARLILIAHSMGGLISRHYLDSLGGWKDCRALFTFGAPFRGSLKAVDALANGLRIPGLIDLSAAVRSMPAVYQLLPRYECVLHEKAYRRVAEIGSLPKIDPVHASDALDFYRSIDQAVKDRDGKLGYDLFPYAGIHQTTNQSAELEDGLLRVVGSRPPVVPDAYEDGDGTVPLVSAIPAELSEKAEYVTYVNERHASLQSNSTVLDDLLRRLLAMQVPGLKDVLGAAPAGKGIALEMQVEDVYLKPEPVNIRFRLREPVPDAVLTAELQDASTLEKRPIDPVKTDDGWRAGLSALDPGSYRVEATVRAGQGITSIRDVFAVEG